MLRSLKSRLILASVLWTSGLLLLMHVGSLTLIHVLPSIHGVHAPLAVIAALVLMAIGALSARKSLSPFRPLRERLLAVRKREAVRVEGAYPSEVQPLIDDLNALLAARERAVARALATAADLAHGLKTPLALLAGEAERAAAAGNYGLGENIAHQVERMSRQVDYQLARARATASGASGAAPCPVGPCTDALIRALAKIYAGRSLKISSTVRIEINARVQREDLDEILGNLLDNACKWAKSEVAVSATQTGAVLSVTVDDDGPGLAAALRNVVLERGVRLDEAAPGSGLGLAIVRDLSELYGGSICLDESPMGGLRAKVLLPGPELVASTPALITDAAS